MAPQMRTMPVMPVIHCRRGARATAVRQNLRWLGAVVAVVLVLLGGCASRMPVIDRAAIASEAIPARPDTELARIVAASTPEGAHSGFRLMPLGSFSLDTRIQLVRRAQVSLDVQYYHLEGDETGRWLLRALREAADRGVRVRLLIDDFYTSGHDDLFLAFAAIPNVQVRVFNPFCCARGSGQTVRFLACIGDWGRVNHRMHNKLFIADGVAAVFGGRNIANEYFLRGESDNFIDLDALVVGKLVEPMAALFDRYWNSDPVYPYEAVGHTQLDPPALRAYFDRVTGPDQTAPPPLLPPNDILGYGPIRDELEDGKLGLVWGAGHVFADHPDKPFNGSVGGELLETSVTYNVMDAVRKAQREVTASSPYFVPGARGMETIRLLRERGVRFSVLTNSLGATDEPLVHLGYSRYRVDMLRLGAELYELSNQRVKRNNRLFHFGSSLGRLHAKLVIIDRRQSFIGSMNLDPRSATINTEIGAVIDSPQLARELQRVIDLDRLQSAYRVRLRPDGALEWLGMDEDGDMILEREPEASLWLKLRNWLLSPLVPEELL